MTEKAKVYLPKIATVLCHKEKILLLIEVDFHLYLSPYLQRDDNLQRKTSSS